MDVDSICYFLSLLYHELFYFVIGQRAGGRNEMNDDTWGKVSGNEGRKLGFLCLAGGVYIFYLSFSLECKKIGRMAGWNSFIWRRGMSGKFTGYVIM